MRRIKATHELTATRPTPTEGAGATDYDTAPTDPDAGPTTVVDGWRVRYHPDGTTLVRSMLGLEAGSAPTVEAPGDLIGTIRVGDDVTLTPLAGGDDTHEGLVVAGVHPVHDRRPRPPRVHLELEDA